MDRALRGNAERSQRPCEDGGIRFGATRLGRVDDRIQVAMDPDCTKDVGQSGVEIRHDGDLAAPSAQTLQNRRHLGEALPGVALRIVLVQGLEKGIEIVNTAARPVDYPLHQLTPPIALQAPQLSHRCPLEGQIRHIAEYLPERLRQLIGFEIRAVAPRHRGIGLADRLAWPNQGTGGVQQDGLHSGTCAALSMGCGNQRRVLGA